VRSREDNQKLLAAMQETARNGRYS
jgi:hypothetical protein